MAELISVLGRPTAKKTTSSSMKPDWTKLPEDLLGVISKKLDNCFDVIHARSVCSPWRSSFPFPSLLIRPSYSLPTYPLENVGTWNLEKIPLFLFRSRAATSEFSVGGIGRHDSLDDIDRQYPLDCLMVNSQILPLGHQYRIICQNPEGGRIVNRMVAFLPLSKEGGGGEEFVVIHYCSRDLLVFKSAERKWVRLANVPDSECTALATFRDRFYATFLNGQICLIDPCSLEVTLLMRPTPPLDAKNYVVQSGNDELFLVERIGHYGNEFMYIVYKLHEEAGRWDEVSDLGDRVFIFGCSLSVCFLAKELPDSCGVSGNSFLITDEPLWITNFCKYNPWWRLSNENRVMIYNKFPVLCFRVEL